MFICRFKINNIILYRNTYNKDFNTFPIQVRPCGDGYRVISTAENLNRRRHISIALVVTVGDRYNACVVHRNLDRRCIKIFILTISVLCYIVNFKSANNH